MTDAISFAVMERLHITRVFAFDRHFAQYGFTVLVPELP
jgi:predicted nucleic acid-binding protein